jgi:hypothetical protein
MAIKSPGTPPHSKSQLDPFSAFQHNATDVLLPSVATLPRPMENRMWLYVLAALGIILALVFLFFRLKNLKPSPAFKELPATDTASATTPSPHNGTRPPKLQVEIRLMLDDRQPRKDAWVDCDYCWVVLCKNHWFHRRRQLFHGHRIPLGLTDAVSTRPAIDQRFVARCDECGKEYVFKPSEVLRYEMSVPPSFRSHPLFPD